MRSMRLAVLPLLAAPIWAHVVSMSTGELRVDGPTAIYEMRIPMYEVAHVVNPETALIDHIRFEGAHRISSHCHVEEDTYVCVANYEFPRLIDRLEVDCTLFAITVPNHVHLLHAVQGANSDEAVFDQTLSRAEIRFHPPSRLEIITRDAGAGIWRALVGPSAVFLLILILAARSRREAILLTGMYLAGEWLMRPLAPRIPWQFSPRFVEAAMALTVAYLALEILILPDAGKRWIVVLALGLFHGLYFAAFPPAYLAGASIMQIVAIAALVWATLRWAMPVIRRAAAVALLLVGLALFAARLIR